MAVLLIYDRDNTHPDPEKEYRGSWKKGYVVQVFEDGTPYVNPPAEPFVVVEITDRTKEQIEPYAMGWIRAVDYSIVGRDVAADGWRLDLFATNANVSGIGSLTRELVEDRINECGGSVVSFSAGRVRFDITVYGFLTSRAFWGRPVSAIVFSEVSYDTGTGVHRISADYNAVPFPPGTTMEQFEGRFADAVAEHGGTIVDPGEGSGVITFDIGRDVAIAAFREKAKFFVSKHIICRKQYYFAPGYVDAVVAAGRVHVTPFASISSYVRNRLDE